MKESKDFKELCEAWFKAHKLNPDNYSILKRVVTPDKWSGTAFYFVYNKAFARPFVYEKSTIAELIQASDFAFKEEFGESITVERDTHGKLVGRHGWAALIAQELEKLAEPKQEEIVKAKVNVDEAIANIFKSNAGRYWGP